VLVVALLALVISPALAADVVKKSGPTERFDGHKKK
jgi:hypothetical protein